jgi:energy-coupling factor transporter ATP-binding protein EcfA2
VEALRFRLGERGWAELMTRLRAASGRGAIVGRQGSGKTTLLLELAERIRASGGEVKLLGADGSERLSRERFDGWLEAARGSRATLFVDGADRLSMRQWWRLRFATRRASGLVTTQHRVGRLATLYGCATNAALLRELVGALLAPSGNPAWLPAAELDRLFSSCGGDIRRALRALYDRWASVGWDG